jgi:hypothetical protein
MTRKWYTDVEKCCKNHRLHAPLKHINSTQYVEIILAVFFKDFKRMEDLRFSQQ